MIDLVTLYQGPVHYKFKSGGSTQNPYGCEIVTVLQSSLPMPKPKCRHQGGRGEANLVSKCKLCSRENSVDLLADSVTR